jgi:hypothetical protein
MDKGNTVPTALAFIGFVAVALIFFFFIRGNVNRGREEVDQNEANSVGELVDMNVKIEGKSYKAKSTSTVTTKTFIENLPLTLQMNDVDGNQKYGCMYYKVANESTKTNKVKKGDILLSGESCVIIAYADFKSINKYVVLGHIDNFDNVPSGSVRVIISPVR